MGDPVTDEESMSDFRKNFDPIDSDAEHMVEARIKHFNGEDTVEGFDYIERLESDGPIGPTLRVWGDQFPNDHHDFFDAHIMEIRHKL